MSFAPYLVFPGTAREAMTAYARIFGATDLQIMGFADAPPGSAPPGDGVMHAQFSAGPGAPLLGSDAATGMDNPSGSPTVFHAAANADRAAQIYAALAEGGTPFMPLAPTFWSPAFGMLRDRWGTTWMITVAPQA
jgi:PhnB protein